MSHVERISQQIATELEVKPTQISAAIDLIDAGNTIPFIARYRKEATGSLDDAQLRQLDQRLTYLRELDGRRAAVIASIESQGKMTEDLHAQILTADSKTRLEDIYLPFKPRRRTRAQIARENGLEPLADHIVNDPSVDPLTVAAQFVSETVADAASALEGARAILIERWAENPDLVGELRGMLTTRGRLKSAVKPEMIAATDAQKFRDYFEFAEPFTSIPSHRALALFRGEKEGILALTFDPEPEDPQPTTGASRSSRVVSVYESRIAAYNEIRNEGRAADRWLAECVRWCWRTKLLVSLAADIRTEIRERAERDAVDVFAVNLKDLLLAAPAGSRTALGLDPGFRTGVKVAVVDKTGRVVDHTAIYPHKPQGQWEQALAVLHALINKHDVELIAIGNGTASRETDQLASELIAVIKKSGARSVPTKVMVSEAGASVYSASEYAASELPDLDVTIRGAVSIARRLQDPLAELVKIDPKSIGVGQYQHDVSQQLLTTSLETVVEDAVNAVGVDVNTASVPLLTAVAGVTETLATAIVAHRDATGPFRNREELTKVPRLGPKAFEQCAGFLRIRGGDNPLDGSAVHPESYPVVEKILASTRKPLDGIIGNKALLSDLRPTDFADDTFGVPTVTDIIAELEKPGRDPRPEFVTAAFADGVEKISDLVPGAIMEGVVTNVAAFGAFVDIGVHQDGLVHISAMSNTFVSDPHDVVNAGDVVKVRVLEADVDRKRISLSLRLTDEATKGKPGNSGGRPSTELPRTQRPTDKRGRSQTATGGRDRSMDRSGSGRKNGAAGGSGGSMADALRRAGFGK